MRGWIPLFALLAAGARRAKLMRATSAAMTVAGAVLVACGRIFWIMPALVYGGGAALLAASFWNLWVKRRRRRAVAAAVPSATLD